MVNTECSRESLRRGTSSSSCDDQVVVKGWYKTFSSKDEALVNVAEESTAQCLEQSPCCGTLRDADRAFILLMVQVYEACGRAGRTV